MDESRDADHATAVRRAYARCRRMQRRHDPTFAVATRCLPADRRPAVHALYGFLRGADEIVDAPRGDDRPQDVRARLDAWQAELEVGLARGRSDHPLLAALVDAGHRHDLPLDRLGIYMDSMRVDCDERVRIPDAAALDRYMEGSAAAVGWIMAPILGLPPAVHGEVARLGVAFQLTNFIRDVAEDWALDRIYLPALPEPDLAQRRTTDGVRAAVAAEVDRARGLFRQTADLEGELDPALRRGVRLARAVYVRVLDRIERRGFDVLRGGTGLPPWELAIAGTGALRGAAPT